MIHSPSTVLAGRSVAHSLLRRASLVTACLAIACVASIACTGCSESPAPRPDANTSASNKTDSHDHAKGGDTTKGHDHDHAHGDHDHDHAHGEHDHDHGDAMAGGHGHHGPSMRLGEATIDGYTITADRDEGAVTAGGEIAADVTVAGTPVPSAVRFWVGTEDAKGSLKALAAIEDASKPNRWHTHVEVPSPMPADAQLWIEVEAADGRIVRASFPLKG